MGILLKKLRAFRREMQDRRLTAAEILAQTLRVCNVSDFKEITHPDGATYIEATLDGIPYVINVMAAQPAGKIIMDAIERRLANDPNAYDEEGFRVRQA